MKVVMNDEILYNYIGNEEYDLWQEQLTKQINQIIYMD